MEMLDGKIMNANPFGDLDPAESDRIIVEGAGNYGFATIPMTLICKPDLPDATIRIYGLLSGFASRGNGVFPGIDKQLELLGMGKDKYYAARRPLVEIGYISIFSEVRKGSRFTNNVYVMHPVPLTRRQIAIEAAAKSEGHSSFLIEQYASGAPCGETLDRIAASLKGTVHHPGGARDHADSNESTPSRDSGKPTKPQVAPCPDFPDTESGKRKSEKTALAGDSGKLTKPQVIPCPDFPNTENRTTNWIYPIPNTTNTPNPTNNERRRARAGAEAPSAPGAPDADGRTDGRIGSSKKRNPKNDAAAEREWDLLFAGCVNRNLIGKARPAFDALVGKGLSPADIRLAWERVQDRARKAGREPRFYPQLKKWLESSGPEGAEQTVRGLSRKGGGAVVPAGAPKTLPALASADEEFGRAYWAFMDARSELGPGVGWEDDPVCTRLHQRMLEERARAYRRLAARPLRE